MLTFHLTFADQPEVCALAARYRSVLAPFDLLDEVPDRWLHLTMQDVAFLDELSGHAIDDVADAATDALAGSGSLDLSFHPPQVGTEGVFLPVADWPRITSVRASLRTAIAQAGLTVPGEETSFWPHASLAYCNASAPAQPVIDAVSTVACEPVTIAIRTVELIALSRDRHLYEWLPVASVRLG